MCNRTGDAGEALLPKLPEGVRFEDGKLIFRMSGTGGLYPYAFGMFGALQDYLDAGSIRLETTSGTGFGAVVLCCNYPMKQVCDLWIKRKCLMFKKHGWYNGLMHEHFINLVYFHCMDVALNAPSSAPWMPFSTDGCAEEGTSGIVAHTVYVQHSETRERRELTNFKSTAEWVGAISGSAAFQPCPGPYSTFKWEDGEKTGPYVDGDFPGCKQGKLQDCLAFPLPGSRTILQFPPIGLFYMIFGLFTEQSWMYDQGYIDTVELLVPQCLAYVNRRSEAQVSSLGYNEAISQLKPHFDCEKCIFTDPGVDIDDSLEP